MYGTKFALAVSYWMTDDEVSGIRNTDKRN